MAGTKLHRYALHDARQGRRIVATLPGLRARLAVRRPGARRQSDRAAPRYITSAEFDPNRDEAIHSAQRLLQAGVSVKLHQWPGTFHGSQAVPSTQVSQRQLAELGTARRRAIAE
jgi:acetyl esterase/lipase